MRHDPARVLSLRVPPDLRPRLDAVAVARGASRHALAVNALERGLDAIKRELPAVVGAAAVGAFTVCNPPSPPENHV